MHFQSNAAVNPERASSRAIGLNGLFGRSADDDSCESGNAISQGQNADRACTYTLCSERTQRSKQASRLRIVTVCIGTNEQFSYPGTDNPLPDSRQNLLRAGTWLLHAQAAK